MERSAGIDSSSISMLLALCPASHITELFMSIASTTKEKFVEAVAAKLQVLNCQGECVEASFQPGKQIAR